MKRSIFYAGKRKVIRGVTHDLHRPKGPSKIKLFGAIVYLALADEVVCGVTPDLHRLKGPSKFILFVLLCTLDWRMRSFVVLRMSSTASRAFFCRGIKAEMKGTWRGVEEVIAVARRRVLC